MNLISIIVPIYNVEAYLVHCLDSILKQTYTNIEVILIDDGSTDLSGKICDEYAIKDERILVIHQINMGVSEARNSGLRVAKGKYIWMPDGDDFADPRLIERLHSAIISGDYDFSMCIGKRVWNDNISFPLTLDLCVPKELTQNDIMKGLYNVTNNELQFQVVWNKLYKKTILNGVSFISTGSEDTLFNNKVFLRSRRAIMLEECLYYWSQRSSSITHQSINWRYIDRIDSYRLCLDEIPDNLEEYRSYCLEKLYKVILHTRYNVSRTKFKKITKEKSQSIIKEYNRCFLKSNISLPMKLLLLVFYYFPITYKTFMWFGEMRAKYKRL